MECVESVEGVEGVEDVECVGCVVTAVPGLGTPTPYSFILTPLTEA